jgi:hypothetical protein
MQGRRGEEGWKLQTVNCKLPQANPSYPASVPCRSRAAELGAVALLILDELE